METANDVELASHSGPSTGRGGQEICRKTRADEFCRLSLTLTVRMKSLDIHERLPRVVELVNPELSSARTSVNSSPKTICGGSNDILLKQDVIDTMVHNSNPRMILGGLYSVRWDFEMVASFTCMVYWLPGAGCAFPAGGVFSAGCAFDAGFAAIMGTA